jgi:hypothetical protein
MKIKFLISIFRLSLIGALMLGLSIAWSATPQVISGKRPVGGWEHCTGTKINKCKDLHTPGCTGDIVACSKTWGAPKDCPWLSGQTCAGASGCEDWRDSGDCPK